MPRSSSSRTLKVPSLWNPWNLWNLWNLRNG